MTLIGILITLWAEIGWQFFGLVALERASR